MLINFHYLAFCDNKDEKPSWFIMVNMSKVKNEDVLPEFQNFLLKKKLVPEKNAFFTLCG